MSDSLSDLLQSGRDITAAALRQPTTPRAGLQRSASMYRGKPATAAPFSPGEFGGVSGDPYQSVLSSVFAGQGVPATASGSLVGRFVEELLKRGHGQSEQDVLQAIETVSKIESSIGDLNDQIAALTAALNKGFPLRTEADPRSAWSRSQSRIPKTSPIKAPAAPSASAPPMPPREPPQVATGGDEPSEGPQRGSKRFEHSLLAAGKAMLEAGEVSADIIVSKLNVGATEAAKILSELSHREVVSPPERGERKLLVHSAKELAGRLGARGAIPGVIQSEETGNTRRFTRMLRGVQADQPGPISGIPETPRPPSRTPPTVEQATDEPDPSGLVERALSCIPLLDPRRRHRQRRQRRRLPQVLRGIPVRPEDRGDEQPVDVEARPPRRPPTAAETAERLYQERLEAEMNLRTPVSERTQGMSLRDRFRRLKRAGNLLTRSYVSDRLGIARPSRQLVVEESEADEEDRRQERLRERGGRFGDNRLAARYAGRIAGSGLARLGSMLANALGAKGIGQKLGGVASSLDPGTMRQFAAAQAAKGVAGAATGALFHPAGQLALAVASLPATIWGGVRAVEAFSSATLEASRGLEKWSGSIAKSFAMLRRQDLALEQSMARNTQGSTVTLAKSVESLKTELQPLKEAARTIVNLMATGAARGVEAGVELAKLDPNLRSVLQLLGLIERKLDEKQKDKGALFFNEVRDLMNGVPPAPKNQRPE